MEKKHIYSPKFDPEKLEETIKKGTKEWEGVTDAAEWVKDHRS